jgi:hypothetical protein
VNAARPAASGAGRRAAFGQNRRMRGFGWTILALLFLDEVLAAVAAGVWGNYQWGVVGAVLAPALVVAVWWAFASPKAPYGGGGVRRGVKVLVFGLAFVGLWDAGQQAWAVAFLVFSVVINALAQLPSVRALTAEPGNTGD